MSVRGKMDCTQVRLCEALLEECRRGRPAPPRVRRPSYSAASLRRSDNPAQVAIAELVGKAQGHAKRIREAIVQTAEEPVENAPMLEKLVRRLDAVTSDGESGDSEDVSSPRDVFAGLDAGSRDEEEGADVELEERAPRTLTARSLLPLNILATALYAAIRVLDSADDSEGAQDEGIAGTQDLVSVYEHVKSKLERCVAGVLGGKSTQDMKNEYDVLYSSLSALQQDIQTARDRFFTK